MTGIVGGADADDVLQDVLILVARKISWLTEPRVFRAWAFRIASRAVLVLHFREEMPLADAAAVLEIPLGTVKSRLAFGLRALRKLLNQKRSL